jgi:coenzyme F420-reducing hydrogenase delta subunit
VLGFWIHIFSLPQIVLRILPLVVKAIGNANNDYVVDAYNTDHWEILIICMKFKEVWYVDSANQHSTRKFTYVKDVVEWSVSCRFCSQKFNLLVSLIGIADRAGSLVYLQRTK